MQRLLQYKEVIFLNIYYLFLFIFHSSQTYLFNEFVPKRTIKHRKGKPPWYNQIVKQHMQQVRTL